MNEFTIPVQSTKTLFKATAYAGLLASLILITTILPVEYNFDPTGIGKALGLTGMHESSTNEAKMDTTAQLSQETPAKYRTDSTRITIPANSGLEYKFFLKEGASIEYSWKVDQGELFFDFHGEPQGDTTGYFESFTVSTAKEVRGTLTVPFTGSHGWYWKNNSNTTVEITLSTKGSYQLIGLK